MKNKKFTNNSFPKNSIQKNEIIKIPDTKANNNTVNNTLLIIINLIGIYILLAICYVLYYTLTDPTEDFLEDASTDYIEYNKELNADDYDDLSNKDISVTDNNTLEDEYSSEGLDQNDYEGGISLNSILSWFSWNKTEYKNQSTQTDMTEYNDQNHQIEMTESFDEKYNFNYRVLRHEFLLTAWLQGKMFRIEEFSHFKGNLKDSFSPNVHYEVFEMRDSEVSDISFLTSIIKEVEKNGVRASDEPEIKEIIRKCVQTIKDEHIDLPVGHEGPKTRQTVSLEQMGDDECDYSQTYVIVNRTLRAMRAQEPIAVCNASIRKNDMEGGTTYPESIEKAKHIIICTGIDNTAGKEANLKYNFLQDQTPEIRENGELDRDSNIDAYEEDVSEQDIFEEDSINLEELFGDKEDDKEDDIFEEDSINLEELFSDKEDDNE